MSCLVIQEYTCFQLNNFYLVVESHLGKFADIDYYKVKIQEVTINNFNADLVPSKLGLLRIGNINGGLSRELQLRHVLNESNLLSELLTSAVEEVESLINTVSEPCFKSNINCLSDANLVTPTNFTVKLANNSNYTIEADLQQTLNNANELLINDYFDEESESTENYEYLEDEESESINELSNSKLLLLSYLPTEGETLDVWLYKKPSYQVSLELTYQICQLFQQVYQQGWCFFQIIPKFIQVDSTIKFFDLTNVCLIGERGISSRETEYCAPELAFDCPMSEGMSTYIVGTLLYQAIYQSTLR